MCSSNLRAPYICSVSQTWNSGDLRKVKAEQMSNNLKGRRTPADYHYASHVHLGIEYDCKQCTLDSRGCGIRTGNPTNFQLAG